MKATKRVRLETPSWFKFGEGSYLCRDHKAQFHTVGAQMAHDDEHHPEKVAARTVTTASPAQMAAGAAAMGDLRKALGR
jgi:hypothetical protein